MKWYKHDPNAALAGMMGLTLEERGAYYTLIDSFYARDGHVPDDDWLMSRILGCNPRTWRRLKLALFQKHKVTVEAGELVPNRCRSTLVEAQLRFHSASSNARMEAERGEKVNEINETSLPTRTRATATATEEKKTDTNRVLGERVVRARAPRSRAHPLPEGWSPKVGVVNMSPVDLFELGKFRDRNLAKNQLYADWEAAWRNWQKQEWYGRGFRGAAAVTSPEDLEARRNAIREVERRKNGGDYDDEEVRTQVRRDT